MKRRVVRTVALVILVLAVGVGIFAAAPGHVESVYTVADVQEGLAHHSRLWVGRTILVRGRLTILGCTGRCLSSTAVLSNPADIGQRLRVTWMAVNPMLALFLNVPVVGPVIRQRIGGVGVYRVRLVRQTFASSPGNLPQYFPYTKRVVAVTNDSAVLVDGLQ
jgi:hypothetical protein